MGSDFSDGFCGKGPWACVNGVCSEETNFQCVCEKGFQHDFYLGKFENCAVNYADISSMLYLCMFFQALVLLCQVMFVETIQCRPWKDDAQFQKPVRRNSLQVRNNSNDTKKKISTEARVIERVNLLFSFSFMMYNFFIVGSDNLASSFATDLCFAIGFCASIVIIGTLMLSLLKPLSVTTDTKESLAQLRKLWTFWIFPYFMVSMFSFCLIKTVATDPFWKNQAVFGMMLNMTLLMLIFLWSTNKVVPRVSRVIEVAIVRHKMRCKDDQGTMTARARKMAYMDVMLKRLLLFRKVFSVLIAVVFLFSLFMALSLQILKVIPYAIYLWSTCVSIFAPTFSFVVLKFTTNATAKRAAPLKKFASPVPIANQMSSVGFQLSSAQTSTQDLKVESFQDETPDPLSPRLDNNSSSPRSLSQKLLSGSLKKFTKIFPTTS